MGEKNAIANPEALALCAGRVKQSPDQSSIHAFSFSP